MTPDYDLVGIGLGPFNLSLASLAQKVPDLRTRFFEKKEAFSWHSEIMFSDSVMQTSYLKDLVTPVDPTSPHSYLNYLVHQGLFYAHLNTGRGHVTRREFERYCQWVAGNLGPAVSFGAGVDRVTWEEGLFRLQVGSQAFTARHLCVGTGSSPWVPEFVQPHLGASCFHAKSAHLARADLTGKRVAVVGGGQTGLEVFRNAFQGRWGEAAEVSLVSRRHTLEPLDESPFTNEYFTPGYVRDFYRIRPENKEGIVRHQRLASDGNTPAYLQDLYNELYLLRHVEGKGDTIRILPQRSLTNLEATARGLQLFLRNAFTGEAEGLVADVVILCTGMRNLVPSCLDALRPDLGLDGADRFQLDEAFALRWARARTNRIYAVNFGRHTHGIAEPQTSLMAWRSAIILNDLTAGEAYPHLPARPNFTHHGTLHDQHPLR